MGTATLPTSIRKIVTHWPGVTWQETQVRFRRVPNSTHSQTLNFFYTARTIIHERLVNEMQERVTEGDQTAKRVLGYEAGEADRVTSVWKQRSSKIGKRTGRQDTSNCAERRKDPGGLRPDRHQGECGQKLIQATMKKRLLEVEGIPEPPIWQQVHKGMPRGYGPAQVRSLRSFELLKTFLCLSEHTARHLPLPGLEA